MSTVGDRWIRSACKMCLHSCGIKVHVQNGVVVKIEGDETNPDNMGKLCPKGNSGIMRLYDPHRVKTPLKRQNPKKGKGVDPQWKEISWDEALTTVATKLKSIRESDPRKLLCAFGDFQRIYFWGWPTVFGSPHFFTTLGTYCGAAYHPVNGMLDGSFAAINDYDHCQYWVQIGSGDGFSSHLHLSGSAKRMADARMRGMKVVVVDPRLSVAAAKADEWIPIRPGTDRAFVLGMMHVLLHELGIFDREFLKKQTNAPYLVGADGYFVRDGVNGKPLIWDAGRKEARAYDDPEVKEVGLEGRLRLDGTDCRSAFQALKDLVLEYTPEKMAEITTVPAETIRRIAQELGTAASIGSTIVIEGKEYPLRPAAVNYYRGAQSHRDGLLDNLTFKLVNLLLGNIDVPGGHLGVPLDHRGFFIQPGPDGMINPMPHQLHPPMPWKYPPDSAHLAEFYPIGFDPGQLCAETLLDPKKFGLDFIPEALLIYHSNPLWNMPGTEKIREILKRLDFIVAIDVLINESTEWADIVLPDHSYLESYMLNCLEAPAVTGHCLRQPVIEPLYNTRDAVDILTELAERIGFLDNWNDLLNFVLGLTERPEYMLSPDRKCRVEEILDRFAKATYGDDHGLEWFKEHGHMVRLRTAEETYQPYGKLRIPLYFEHIKKVGDDLRGKMAQVGVPWDTSNYLPLPIWKPSPIHLSSKEFDLYAITFKEAIHNFAETVTVPWLTEVAWRDPLQRGIIINAATARTKGIRDGDRIVVESSEGRLHGTAKLTQGIHPEVIAVPNAVTRWAEHPVIAGDDAHFNQLLPASLEYTDNATGAFENCAKVRVFRTPISGGPG